MQEISKSVELVTNQNGDSRDLDYRGAANAADEAYQLVDRCIGYARDIAGFALRLKDGSELSGELEEMLMDRTSALAKSLADATDIAQRLNKHQRAISLAYETLELQHYVLHLATRHCVSVAEKAYCLLNSSENPDEKPTRFQWIVFSHTTDTFFSTEDLGDGLPPVYNACSMCQSVAITCEQIAYRAAGNGADEPNVPENGPYKYRWVVEGKVIPQEMNAKAWLMVEHLWKQRFRDAELSELALPVYGDHSYDTSGDAIPSLRKRANKYFRSHNIGFHVTVEGGPRPRVKLKEGAPKTTNVRKTSNSPQ